MQRVLLVAGMFLILASGVLLGAQGGSQKPGVKLDGTWTVISWEMEGKKLPGKTLQGMKMLFQDAKLTIQQGQRKLGVGKYKINVGKKPYIIDYREGPDITSPYDAGIFEIDGDLLKLCTSAEPQKRPIAFDSKLGWLFVLKREAAPVVASRQSKESVGYARHVRPFLARYCIECHNPKSLKAGLDLETYKALRDGSDRGPVLVPGKPDESLLVLCPEGKKQPHMPPKKAKRRPTPAEVSILRAWVLAGGADDSSELRVTIPAIKPRVPVKAGVTALAYRGDGQLLAVGQYQSVALFDMSKNALVKKLTGLPGPVTALAFNSLGTKLAVVSGSPGTPSALYFYLLPPPGQEWPAPTIRPAHQDVILDLAFSRDGKTLATASYDTTIKLWDAADGKELHTLKEHSDSVYGISFSANGKLLASGAADRAVKVWDVATGKLLYTFGEPTDWVYAVAWSPDGRHLAAGGVDKSIRIWQTGAEKGKVVQSVFAHEAPILRLIYSVDGKTLYSLGEDRTVKAWDSARMVERKVYARQPEAVLSLAVRPDGKQLALGRYDGALVLLDEVSGEVSFQAGRNVPVSKKLSLSKLTRPKGSPPVVQKVTPSAGQRGRVLHLLFEGEHLDEVESLSANYPGVTAKLEPGKSGNAVHVKLSFPNLTPAGVYELTLHTRQAKSAPVSFTVDLFPLSREQEPNDSLHRSQHLTLPVSVEGSLYKAGDVDYYRFEIGDRPQLGVQALTTGSKIEPVLQLLDMTGKVLTESSDGILGYAFAFPGSYILAIRDREFRGGAGMTYRLHLGDIPIVTSLFPLGLQRGSEKDLQIEGVYLGNTNTVRVKAPKDAEPGTRLPVRFTTPWGAPLGRKEVVIGEYPEVVSTNGKASLAKENSGFGSVAVPGTANGVLRHAGQRNLWRFRAKKGQRLILEVEASRLGMPLDSFIEILDPTNQVLPRATLRSLAKTYVVFRDHGSRDAGIRIEAWDELAVNDFILLGNELLRIRELPPNPDADCVFFSAGGRRLGFLDTTPAYHAMGMPLYKVEIHPPGSIFPPNGFPVTTLYYRNDDGGPSFGRDSRLTFDPPADGEYHVRIGDVHGRGGSDFVYRLTIRHPRPSFVVSFTPQTPVVSRGSALPITVSAERIDGYDGEITLRLENLPPGFHAPQTSVPAGENRTVFALYADPGAVVSKHGKSLKLVATGRIEDKEVVKEAVGGMPKLIDPGDLVTTTAQAEVSVKRGGKTYLTVNIERKKGFEGRVPLDVRGLPHGVRVLDIGLNGILVNENESRRTIVIQADAWVRPTTHPFVVLSRQEARNSEHAARSVLLRVVP